jgi:hypothetical protein
MSNKYNMDKKSYRDSFNSFKNSVADSVAWEGMRDGYNWTGKNLSSMTVIFSAVALAFVCIALCIILFKMSAGTYQWKNIKYSGGTFYSPTDDGKRITQLETWIAEQGLTAPLAAEY